MIKIKRAIALVLAGSFLSVLGLLHPSRAADPLYLYRNYKCHVCHGDNAKSPILNTYPKLVGQNKEYTFQQIRDIQEKKRTNGQSAIMREMIAPVNEADIKALSKWIETLE